jgi:hypothetical protein
VAMPPVPISPAGQPSVADNQWWASPTPPVFLLGTPMARLRRAINAPTWLMDYELDYDWYSYRDYDHTPPLCGHEGEGGIPKYQSLIFL